MFQLIFSLQQQSMVKVADNLWNEECMDRVLAECRSHYYDKRLPLLTINKRIDRIVGEVTKQIVTAKVCDLFLPGIIGEKLLCIIKKVGLQKVEWYFYHEKQWSIKRLPRVFYRTAWGTIDRKKTSESLLMDNTVDICERYSLACCYCFEKEAHKLSKEILPRVKKLLTNHAFGSSTTFEDGKIVKFWNNITRYARLEFDQKNRTNLTGQNLQQEEITMKMENIYREAFRHALESANNVAAKYFWRRLLKIEPRDALKLNTLLEKMFNICMNQSEDLGVYRPLEYFIDTTFFLLRQMTKDQQTEAFDNYSDQVIELYLSWSFQSLFPQSVKTFFCHMSPHSVMYALIAILRNSERDMYKVFNYQDPFTQFWQEFSVSQKLGVIKCLLQDSCILSSLIIEGHCEVFILLNTFLTSTQKKKFLFGECGMQVCKVVAENEAWNSLKLLFEATLSPRVVAKFKIKFKNFRSWEKNVNITKVFDILNKCQINLRALSH